MSFIQEQTKQIRSGGLPVLWRKMSAFPQWFGSTRYGSGLAYYLGKLAVALSPGWAKSHERLGDALLNRNRFEEGISHWRKAISLQTNDRYSELYQRAITLLHRGESDAMVNILRMGIETQEEFTNVHQLDRLGIRFLREWTYAIGHIALLDIYVKMGILGWRGPYRPIVLDARPANRCYLDYWQRYLPYMVTDPKGVELLTPLATRLEEHLHVINSPDGLKIDYITATLTVQKQWEAEGRAPLLALSDSDRKRGKGCLQRLGVSPDAWFVSLHVRDTGTGNPRDADIGTYRMAMESIVAHGGWVIRMGEPSMSPLPPMSQVIDYAHNEARSDWMDVFLWASCRFFIGTRSGPAHVPPTFGVPCVLTNSFPMAMPFPYPNIGIYKLYQSGKDERYMSFNEACTSRVGLAEPRKYIASLGIRLVDNTPEEINDVVLEMLERLEGTLKYSAEDEQLQERFRNLKPTFLNQSGISPGLVGREFLRKYAYLL